MKVFQINVKHNFLFYIKNRKIFSIYDDKHPILNSHYVWNSNDNSYERKVPVSSYTDKVTIPAFQIYKKDFEKWFVFNIEPMINFAIQNNSSEVLKKANILVCTRDISSISNEEMLEVGAWLPKESLYTNYQNKKLQKLLDRYLNLKAFW
jgi:hypothetical protein